MKYKFKNNLKYQTGILLCFILLISASVFSQELSHSNNDADKLEQPINGFTGAINYNIPLGGVSSGSISYPISLTYYSDGFKPNLPAGPAGLGWALNMNYHIRLQVLGNYDVLTQNCANVESWPNCEFDEVISGEWDGAFDLYVYNFNGKTGRFFIDESGQINFLQKENIEISTNGCGLDCFKVVLTDGTIIFLSTWEFDPYDEEYNGVFLPNKVVSSDGNDSIKILYTPNAYSFTGIKINVLSY